MGGCCGDVCVCVCAEVRVVGKEIMAVGRKEVLFFFLAMKREETSLKKSQKKTEKVCARRMALESDLLFFENWCNCGIVCFFVFFLNEEELYCLNTTSFNLNVFFALYWLMLLVVHSLLDFA